MHNIYLLDCTLRDGGYINNWKFGEDAIKSIIKKIEKTCIELIEIGFIKGDTYNPNVSLFPDTKTCKKIIGKKKDGIKYVGMIDMSAPVPLERITPNDGKTIDLIRVIFKKPKLNEAIDYCAYIKKQGYEVYANFVNTDSYTDKEFIEGIEKVNQLEPDGVAIVDTFGMMKRRQLFRLISIADNNLSKGITLCYHAHNNLQQAFGNAEALVEMNLRRNICIDACVFGMGRGAGNLNLELFAEYMNENFGTNYHITPMLEIMDEYLSNFYHKKFWGYSLPLYLSATSGCHPNYAIYLAEKETLSVKAFNEILYRLNPEEKEVFNKDVAEKYYKEYFENFIEDKRTIEKLRSIFLDRVVVMIAPGKTSIENISVAEQNKKNNNALVVTVNFYDERFYPDFIFCSNERKFNRLPHNNKCREIITSNISTDSKNKYIVNYSSYLCKHDEIIDNAGVMLIRLLSKLNVSKLLIIGMDGYSEQKGNNITNYETNEKYFSEFSERNRMISDELRELKKDIDFQFLTPTLYEV